MIAKVRPTRHITRSVMYGQDERKGGEVLLFQHVDMTATPEEQAADLVAMSKPSIKVKAYNFILSFDDEDTEKLRQMDTERRFKFLREVIKAFIAEMEKRGTNITDCPFVVARHGNTNNEHFHMTVLTTTVDGKHINDSFIKKNAIRAAAKVKRDAGRKATRSIRSRHSGTMADIQDRMRRRDAVERANRRKAMLRRLIEKIAKDATAADFAKLLKAEGMTLCEQKKGWGVTVTIEDGKERFYTFAQLEVNADLVTPLVTPQKEEEKTAEERKMPEWKRIVPSPSRSILNAAKRIIRPLNVRGEQSGGQSREDEISKGNYEDPDETRRGGGMKR